ncbi:MAG: hypothetical protein R3F14_22825 [Polyangiaceae bacterium]
MECLELCSVNIGICQQGCKADAECNRSCAKTNELCTITCSKRK